MHSFLFLLCKAGHRRKALLLYLRAAEAGYEIAQNNAAYILRNQMVPLGVQGAGDAESAGDADGGGGGGRFDRGHEEECADRVGRTWLVRAVMQGSRLHPHVIEKVTLSNTEQHAIT